jgi:hypothetical protein
MAPVRHNPYFDLPHSYMSKLSRNQHRRLNRRNRKDSANKGPQQTERSPCLPSKYDPDDHIKHSKYSSSSMEPEKPFNPPKGPSASHPLKGMDLKRPVGYSLPRSDTNNPPPPLFAHPNLVRTSSQVPIRLLLAETRFDPATNSFPPSLPRESPSLPYRPKPPSQSIHRSRSMVTLRLRLRLARSTQKMMRYSALPKSGTRHSTTPLLACRSRSGQLLPVPAFSLMAPTPTARKDYKGKWAQRRHWCSDVLSA